LMEEAPSIKTRILHRRAAEGAEKAQRKKRTSF